MKEQLEPDGWPTWEECEAKYQAGFELEPLEEFIWHYEPRFFPDSIWRKRLVAALKEVR